MVQSSVSILAAFGMKTSSRLIDSIWIFEKEESLIDNQTPQYEGVIIEYLHKVKKVCPFLAQQLQAIL